MRLEKIKEKKLELQELRENLWRWREGGGGRKKDGNEKIKELRLDDIEKKVKKIDVI